MKIRLQHNTSPQHQPTAAFIREESARSWIMELGMWSISPSKFSCYVLPQSSQSPSAAGLFVISKDALSLPDNVKADLYGCIGGKLYIPVHASIYPECTSAELKQISMWDVQVFHPSIGLVGFEKKDAISLHDLFEYSASSGMAWNHAHAGMPPRPQLQQIQVVQPSSQQMLDEIKDGMNLKPLDEIPGAKEGKTTAIEKIFDAAKYGLFKAMHSILKGLSRTGNAFPPGEGNNRMTPGMLEQFQNWLEKNMDWLEKKRQSELQRLAKMLDDNADEGLQYAIPLDSKYLDRGKSAPSFSLGWRSTNFNLKNLGGGGAVDSWDIGDMYYTLRDKYLANAKSLMEKNDYKKAAYVYAHLLADYASAANVLVQGKYYREAAALYKDHLHNTRAAAECLENGGLFAEAIELYKVMNEPEKVGDLYCKMEQPERANNFYETTVGDYLQTENHLEAARVLHQKMRDDERAKETLLEGWKEYKQDENCLKQYFDIVSEHGHEEVNHQVEKIYRNVNEKGPKFLSVLHHIRQRYANAAIRERSTEIAYEIISKRAGKEDHSLLHLLQRFVPDDILLPTDVSRYVQRQPRQRQINDQEFLKLDPATQWMAATWYHDQLLIVGTKNKKLQLVRCNWYKNIEYYSWATNVEWRENFRIISSPHYTNRIIIKGLLKTFQPHMRLPQNKYFSKPIEINQNITFPTAHASSILGIALNQKGGTTTLFGLGNEAMLHYYDGEGKLENNVPCKPANKDKLDFQSSGMVPFHRPLILVNSFYFTYVDQHIICIDESGIYTYFNAESGIRMIAVANRQRGEMILVSTNAGCLLLRYDLLTMELLNGLFAEECIPTIIEFTSSTSFVLAEKNKIFMYSISEEQVYFIRSFSVSTNIVAVLPSYNKHKFAVVEEGGVISVHEK